ncbi:unnamed protein product [Citrullus colocynthis]|uniref:Uncharacterized protein n=1 Tax=Citrullus colocynthis TaxID=252529 RepID=A0ABP0Z9N8_9ROSI
MDILQQFFSPFVVCYWAIKKERKKEKEKKKEGKWGIRIMKTECSSSSLLLLLHPKSRAVYFLTLFSRVSLRFSLLSCCFFSDKLFENQII